MISLLQVSASTFGQRFTMQKKNASLNEVFTEIRKQTGYFVIYADDKIDASAKLDINFKQTDLKDVLSFIGKNQELQYTIDDKNISFKPKVPTFLERVVATLAGIDVSGRIVDADGRGLPGASVSVKGKGKAVSTGANGSFYLKGVAEDAVLVISFIGYVNKEVKASANLRDVVLELSTSKLDEVQVIAYGTTTQRLSTGNVTTIKADVIEKQPVNNPLLALQGRVPGLFIEQATGFAGTGVKVRIQGQNSMFNGSDPLFVIDGIPYISQILPGDNSVLRGNGVGLSESGGSPLNFINPSDIESIDILKDADATAIYGSRAANGAILITTKKGKAGETTINLNLQSGWGGVPHRLDLMNSEQYLEMRREALSNDGIENPIPGQYGDNDLNGNWDNSRNTDWQKELIGKKAAYTHMYTSFSGGSERTTYLIGAGYHRETSVFPGDYSDQKASVNFNINSSSKNQKFHIQLSGMYLLDNNQLPNIDLTEKAMTLAPVAPNLRKADGSINWENNELGFSTFDANPIGYTYNKFQTKTGNLTSNFILNYQLLPGLDIKSSFGYNQLVSNSTNKNLLQSSPPEYIQYGLLRSTVFRETSDNSWIIEPQISYKHKINQGNLDLLLGASIQQKNVSGSETGAAGFSNDLVMDDIMSAPKVFPVSSINSVYKYNALFARLNYNWKDKYIFNLTGRRDGSSRFGPNSQFHNFGAVGLAWIFSNESFVKDHLSFLSFGKLRASYGTTGSDQIGDYQYLSLYDPRTQSRPYQGIPIYKPTKLTNPYLEWEETKKLQVGLDFGLFNDRILVNSNYYVNKSSNQLGIYNLPSTTGFSGIVKNQNWVIRNSGLESTMSTTNFKGKDFYWSSSVNITIPRTLLVDYPNLDKSSVSATALIGQPLSALSVFHFLGVNPTSGVYEFADKDGNPTISPDENQDKIQIIDLAPKFYGGFQNTISYKSFQIDFSFSFVKQIAQNYKFGSGAGSFNGGTRNQLVTLMSRWQHAGDVASIQKFTTGFELDQSLANVYKSDAGWTDASYIKLKNIAVSWQLPNIWMKKIRFDNCSLFIQGQNLFTITSYTGLDPEIKSISTLPPLRVVTIGVKAGF